MADRQFIMGLRVGLNAALAVADKWDRRTINRILDLIREVEPASAIEARSGETGTGSTEGDSPSDAQPPSGGGVR